MRCFVVCAVGRLSYTLFALLMAAIGSPARAEETNAVTPPVMLTNLLQLRRCGEQIPSVLHPLRITASVVDADPAGGVLVLRDDSAVEFVQVDFRGQEIKPGARICLEGTGCGIKPKNFGLAIVPGLVVDNDGLTECGLHPERPFFTAASTRLRCIGLTVWGTLVWTWNTVDPVCCGRQFQALVCYERGQTR